MLLNRFQRLFGGDSLSRSESLESRLLLEDCVEERDRVTTASWCARTSSSRTSHIDMRLASLGSRISMNREGMSRILVVVGFFVRRELVYV